MVGFRELVSFVSAKELCSQIFIKARVDKKGEECLTPVYLLVKALFEVQSAPACLVLQFDKVLS